MGHLGAFSGPIRGQPGAILGQLVSSCISPAKLLIFHWFLLVLRSVPGHLGVMSEPSWIVLEPFWADLGPFWAISVFLWGHFGPSCGFWVSSPIGNTFSTGVGTSTGGHLGPSWGHFLGQETAATDPLPISVGPLTPSVWAPTCRRQGSTRASGLLGVILGASWAPRWSMIAS